LYPTPLTHADVFAALGVILAFKTLDEGSRQDVRVPKYIDIDEIVAHGNSLLEEVGGQLHPIAARYLKSLQRMEAKLQTVSTNRAKVIESLPPLPAEEPPLQQQQIDYSMHPCPATMNEDFTQFQMGQPMVFVEDFSEIESMFYNTGWFGQVGEWEGPFQ
jgi:hypothetical protein